MSEGSDWRHRRSVHGREHLGRPGQPPADGREPGDDLERELGAPGEESLDLSEVGFDENFLDALSRDVPRAHA